MHSDPNCIFCKIAAGQIPCHKIAEDGHVLVFLDIGPLSRGHTLILPKDHYATIDQMPDAAVGACAAWFPRVSRALVGATGAQAWNILQNNGKTAGQSVDHVHFHVIPRAAGDNLGYRWPAGKLDAAEAKTLLEQIKKGLREEGTKGLRD